MMMIIKMWSFVFFLLKTKPSSRSLPPSSLRSEVKWMGWTPEQQSLSIMIIPPYSLFGQASDQRPNGTSLRSLPQPPPLLLTELSTPNVSLFSFRGASGRRQRRWRVWGEKSWIDPILLISREQGKKKKKQLWPCSSELGFTFESSRVTLAEVRPVGREHNNYGRLVGLETALRFFSDSYFKLNKSIVQKKKKKKKLEYEEKRGVGWVSFFGLWSSDR